jgi:hypothetical protein
VEDISVLQNFPNIMYLDISNNNVSSLRNLESMAGLVQLRARNNKLTECLNFYPPHCKESQSWPEGEKAIGSMLTLVDLSQNSIRRIGDLSKHRFLECLLLSKNQLGWIEGLYNLRFLQTLDLSNNKITQIEGLDNLPLRELRLANNKIISLDGLDKLPCLCSLDVSNNQIKTLVQVQSLIHLSYLDVSGNSLAFIRQVEYLTSCNWLHVVLIDRNPCALKLHYRLRILYRLPNLKRIDHVLVSTEEKLRALNLYHSPEGDLRQRQAVWEEHCPSVSFEDFAPQQLLYDEENDITPEEMALGELLTPLASTAVGNASSFQAPEMGAQVLEASAVDEAPGGRILESASVLGEGLGALGVEASRVYDTVVNTEGEGGFYGGDFDQIEENEPSAF